MQQPVEFELDIANCFDCSRPLWGHLVISIIGLTLIVVASFFWKSPRRWLHALSRFVGALAVVWYLLGTSGVVKFGILWPTTDGDEVLIAGGRYTVTATRAADYIYLVAWYATSLLLAIGARAIGGKFGTKR